jgi:hypothetical protein
MDIKEIRKTMIGSVSGGITNENYERKIICSVTGFLDFTLLFRTE